MKEELSDQAALEAGIWLLERVKAVWRPIPEDGMELYKKIEKETRAFWKEVEKRKGMKQAK